MNIYPLSHGFDNNAIKKFIQAADESVRIYEELIKSYYK